MPVIPKRPGGMAEIVECLTRKLEALSSNPNTEEKKRQGRRRWNQEAKKNDGGGKEKLE
jgi:hypothetical protein